MQQRIKENLSCEYYLSKSEESPNQDVISKMLFMDLTSYLPDDLLIKVDRMSMANSLEVRCPFLDHKFVEFAGSIPNDLKLHEGESKYILKKAFSKLLPKEILTRHKMGFAIPLDAWFRGDLRSIATDVLLGSDTILNTFFRKKVVQNLLESHFAYKGNHGTLLWLLVNFVMWYQMFIENLCFEET
jgi:asparagine synthase (glutamine-hydrolysing)